MVTSSGKPRFGDRAKRKIRQRAEVFLASAPVPQERLVAGAQVVSGLSRGWVLLSPTIRLFGRNYFMTLTEGHVLFCWLSAWNGRPVAVPIVVPRDQVRVTNFRIRGSMGWMQCQVPGRPPMTLWFHRLWRPEVEALLAELGTD